MHIAMPRTKACVASGLFGLGVMFFLMAFDVGAPSTWLLLWPSSIFGIGYNGQGGLDGFIVWSMVLGGQFVVYATFGWFASSLLAAMKGRH